MTKKKILFVVSDFFHNGAQREMFEIDSALNKENFEVTILSLIELNTREDLPDYFYQRHIELGTKIIFLKNFIKKKKKSVFDKIFNKLNKTFFKKEDKKNTNYLTDIFDQFDKIVFMGEYVYQALENRIPANYFKEAIIFVMSSRFQSENYRNFNKDNHYFFIGGFDKDKQIEYEFENFKNYHYQFMPLCLTVSDEFNKWKFDSTKQSKKIGIFTRLHKDKPLDPYLYAYQILLSQGLDIELHIFGVGNYIHAEYDRYLNNLDLNEKVNFRGHQSNMKQTILEEKLDLVWFQGYNNLPAGYAGLEVCLTGTPQLFWDFFKGKNENINSSSEEIIYPHYKNILSFVESSKLFLFEEPIAKQFSKKQFNDVFNNRNIYKKIAIVEEILLKD